MLALIVIIIIMGITYVLETNQIKQTKVRKHSPATQSPVSGSANVPQKATALKRWMVGDRSL